MTSLTLQVEVQVHIFLTHLWVIAALSHVISIHVLCRVTRKIGLILNKHWLLRELFVHLYWAAEPLTLLIEEYTIVLSIRDLFIQYAERGILLLAITKVDFLLDRPCLISWHELLCMLIWISQLTRAFVVKVTLRTLIEVTLRTLFKVTASVIVLDLRLILI